MEKKSHFLSKHLLWASVILHIAMFSSATNVTTTETPEVLETEVNEYAWSAWSSWSPCSRTCGGGVSMQERECLPRIRNAPLNSSIPPLNETVPPPVITVRVTRQTHGGDCQGIDKRYHECNNFPCPGGEMNSRAEQCAAFDRRPFRGRFYTWVPYIDGNSPCTLNCRPLGQQFYASLSLVADGTPCTKQGFRAICVHGTCKAVGREGVLSTSVSRDLRCGRRLVSGLFSRPRLPLGYSYVTTVPKGACRLNVSEIMPSENYIALKISNSSYIVNGEFAVSAPGTYEAAGARFIYTRSNGLDVILALGPIQHPIDIMILYTQPNPSLKYEYFTESLPGEIETEAVKKADFADFTPTSAPKHTRRHHNYDAMPRLNVGKSKHLDTNKGFYNTDDNIEENIVGNRKFIWKVVSYTQCTRSCGGGIQLGKYRCVEDNAHDREVSPVHCTGTSPPARRRRCGAGPCPPRWRAAAWSSCPICGPATRTRIVGCVQDHSRGITKISDQKCPAPKPPSADKCNIPDCNEMKTGEVQISSKRVRPREHVDEFRDGPVYTVSVNETAGDLGPEYSFSATAGWFSTEWSECVGWCVGGGVQSRGVRCADPSGCTPRTALEDSRSCTPKLDCEPLEGEWFTGDWSPCSSSCSGKQVRGVLCIGGTGRHLKDSACRDPKPANKRDCGTECPAWYYSDWGQCISNCTGAPTGIQRRSVVCARGDKPVLNDAECGPAPPATRACEPQCVVVSPLTPAPGSIIESRRVPVLETTTTTQRIVTKDRVSKDCEDNLTNCVLAVQARLCHYKYYIHNCCHSCNGRM